MLPGGLVPTWLRCGIGLQDRGDPNLRRVMVGLLDGAGRED
jgi:hypothetical protein